MISRITMLRSLLIFTAALLSAHQAHAHQASDAFAKVQTKGSDTVVMSLAVALKDVDLALPEADADNNRELNWREIQAVRPNMERWLGHHVMLTCQVAGAAPDFRELAWDFDALEERSDGVYARLRTMLTCPVGTAVSLRYTLMKDLDPTHRVIIKSNMGGEEHASVLIPGAAPLMLRNASTQMKEPSLSAVCWKSLRSFVPEGVHHILTGYDHLAFLLALLLPLNLRHAASNLGVISPTTRRMGLRELLWTVTAFTLGHSVTLVLATLGLSAIPAWVEPAIAVSIGFSAWLNLYPQPWLQTRWLALGFGLIHGLGFANIMKEADLSSAPLAWALAGFNAGVELGQLVCVALWCAINLVMARWKYYDWVVTRGGSIALILLAMFWTWERLA